MRKLLALLILLCPLSAFAQSNSIALSGQGFAKSGQQCYTNKANTFNKAQTFNGQIISSITSGTAPFVVASNTQVTNLNCSSLEGTVIGASGSSIPLNNGNNTISGSNTFTGGNVFNSAAQVTIQGSQAFTIQNTGTGGLSNGHGQLAAAATTGFIIAGQGSTNDISIQNKNNTSTCVIPTGTTTFNCTTLQQNGTQVISIPGTGLSASGATLSSNAVYQLDYQPGLLTAVNSTIGVYSKVSKASTVDNIEGSAVTFSCVANPTITMYECGTSPACVSPTTIGTVTVTAAGTVVDGTVSNSAITAGDYIGWAMTAGTCASIDIAATAQVHSN